MPTFSDALAAVRRELWTRRDLPTSSQTLDILKMPAITLNSLINAACYAA
jgi:hypothetical protein